MTEPRNPLEVVEEALAAALAYIDESPCDPDITREQWTAWQRLEESSARAALALVRKMRADAEGERFEVWISGDHLDDLRDPTDGSAVIMLRDDGDEDDDFYAPATLILHGGEQP
jgi:hypothetical protein